MSVLNRATLASVAEQHRLDGVSVDLPRYPRHCDKRICHIGVGGFHRAHQAWYLHRLLQDGLADGWGIVGIGLRAQDRVLSGILRHQDGLYSLWELGGDTRRACVLGALFDTIDARVHSTQAIHLSGETAPPPVSLTRTTT